MNLWLRVAAVVSAAFAGVLLLRAMPPVIVLALFIVGAFVVTQTLKTNMRREAAVGAAVTLGLRLEPSDPFGLLGYPLSLFGRGREGEVGDVRSGTWRGVDVKVFEYSYVVAGHPVETPTPSGRARFSCAMTMTQDPMPSIVAEPASFVLSLGAQAQLDEVEVDAGSGVSSFVVRGADPVVARKLVSGDVGEWLVEGTDDWGFEVSGRLLLIYGAPMSPPTAADVLSRLDDLRSRLHDHGSAARVVRGPEADEPA